MFVALGEVDKKFEDATSTFFATPNTIMAEVGIWIGLLILCNITDI